MPMPMPAYAYAHALEPGACASFSGVWSLESEPLPAPKSPHCARLPTAKSEHVPCQAPTDTRMTSTSAVKQVESMHTVEIERQLEAAAFLARLCSTLGSRLA